MNDPRLIATPDTTFELASFVAPLLSIARERIGQDVVVPIGSGFSVDGRLESVNDDETITVTDYAHRYDIALGSVAVIEGSRS